MTESISIATISRTLGDQLLEIIRLREALAALESQIAERDKRLVEIEAECDRLRMELERVGLDRVVDAARIMGEN